MRTTTGIVLAFAIMFAGCTSPALREDVRANIDADLAGAAKGRVAAAQPDAVSQALLPPLVLDLPRSAQPLEPRFDLVVNNAPANQVFMALVTGTRYSMLVHPDIKETISVNLKDVTVSEALEAIREIYGYEHKFQGSRIYIQPVTIQTRLFQVNYLAGRRVGRAEVRVSSGSIQTAVPAAAGAPGSPAAPATGATTSQSLEGSRVTTSTDNDFWGDLNTALRAIVGADGGRSVVVNSNAGVVMVRAMPNELRAVEQYLKAMSLVVERQVMLEAKIIEVTLSDQFANGINWSAFRFTPNSRFAVGSLGGDPVNAAAAGAAPFASRLGAAAGFTSSVFGLAFQTNNFAALIEFLESQGTVHVLSSPRIATLNNQKAVIKVGTDDFFVTNISTTTTPSTVVGGVATVSPTVTTQPFFSGIALDVTPQISGDDQITLHIHPSVSQVIDKIKTINLGAAGGILTLPLASSTINESDTIVRVQDGTIAAIGGLMRQTQTNARAGFPGTTDTPVAPLFGTRNQVVTKSELVILLKVTVIKGDQAWQQQAQELNDRMQSLRRPVYLEETR